MKNLVDYVEHIRNDYRAWQTAYSKGGNENDMKIRDHMLDKFVNSVSVSEGKKYIKIICGGSVHSFVVKEATGKFQAGDILKAASAAAPATNFARGNVLRAEWKHVRWTGA